MTVQPAAWRWPPPPSACATEPTSKGGLERMLTRTVARSLPPRSLAGNQVAYLLREAKDGKSVRCSMRSNPPYEVGAVAQALGGGGHRQAAGCTIVGDLANAHGEVLARLRAQLAAVGKAAQ